MIVGAGFSALYLPDRMRGAGSSAVVLEAAEARGYLGDDGVRYAIPGRRARRIDTDLIEL